MMNEPKLKIIVQDPQHTGMCHGQKDLQFLQNTCQRGLLVHSYFEQDLLYVLWGSSMKQGKFSFPNDEAKNENV